jgi:hypothetical protein
MAAVRGDMLGLGEDEQYGRPFAWHQQAARHDFLAAWAAIEAPVLVVFNEFDQYETEHGHRLIVDTVNRLRPGSATWVINAGLDHSNYRYDSAIAAYADEEASYDPAPLRRALEDWLRVQLAAEAR